MQQQQWNIHFGPGFNPQQMAAQQMAAQQAQREAAIRQMAEDKRCEICRNTYLIDDQITMCMKSNQCVDGKNGQSCPDWENLYG